MTQEKKEQRKQYEKNYIKEHKNQIKQYQKNYRKDNAEKLHIMEVERHNRNKLNKSISVSINKSLQGFKLGRHWENLLNYTLQQLKEHLESQFTPEMNWDNYGSYWEIDHIIPQNLFNITDENCLDFKICWSLLNLRSLEKSLNRQRPKDGRDISEDVKQQILGQNII
nr:hypothetical protein YSBCXYJI_YSBCXYJI_CDS_0157 [Caudoviricetes sp.]